MKSEIILQREKELNTKFEEVDIDEIIVLKSEKTAKYSTDQNENIIGLCIANFNLKEMSKQLSDSLELSNSLTHLNLYNNQISKTDKTDKKNNV